MGDINTHYIRYIRFKWEFRGQFELCVALSWSVQKQTHND